MYLAMKRCICVVSVCITEYQSYSPKISIPVPTPVDSGATPADSGATPVESGDSFWNQWGTEKYCSDPPTKGIILISGAENLQDTLLSQTTSSCSSHVITLFF